MKSPVKTSQSASGKVSIRDKLIAAGERLIGEHGLDALSLRQVSAMAGTRNNYAVQYHFGDVDGLIRAIIAERTPMLEQRRSEMLEVAPHPETLSTRQLIDIFFRPLIEFVDTDGQPRFGRFMLALHQAPEGWQPLDDMFFMMPVTERMLDLLQAQNPTIPAPVLWQRMQPISAMVLAYACSPSVTKAAREYREAAIEGLFDMAAAAIAVPVRESSATKIYGRIF